VDLVPPFCEIFRPALGMDTAAVSDEEEDHIRYQEFRLPFTFVAL
jgi:hypothetical protein